MISRRELMKTLGIGAAGILAFSGRTFASTMKGPNILFIMCDDATQKAITAYNAFFKEVHSTPNIDRLAQEGVRFTNAFCTNSICSPVRAVNLTGKYSNINGVKTNEDTFDLDQQAYPQLLRAAGYDNALIGKWHLFAKDQEESLQDLRRVGFDYFSYMSNHYLQGTYKNPEFNTNGTIKQELKHSTEAVADKCIDWLSRSWNREKPFHLCCHFKAPHSPWDADREFNRMYKDIKFPEPETLYDDYDGGRKATGMSNQTMLNFSSQKDKFAETRERMDAKEYISFVYQDYMSQYLPCVKGVDFHLGRLLDYLDKNKLTGDTIVFFTSDQGFFLGEHSWYDKRWIYEQSLSMPLIVRYPGFIEAGSVCDDMALNLDYAPTILDYAGVPVPADMQGKSLRPLLEGKTPPSWRNSIYYHYWHFPSKQNIPRHYGIRTKRYKLMHFYYPIDSWELIDLQTDPEELINRIDDPAYQDMVKSLKVELWELMQHYKDTNIPEDSWAGSHNKDSTIDTA